MWGAEMGINARGVVVANEAVFTRQPLLATGLTGMDLVRLALQQAQSAAHAVDTITTLCGLQGGRMGHRHRRFSYHGAFAIADAHEAWHVETAGRFWAARRIRGVATISNVLSIGPDFDRVHPGAADHARRRGWLPRGAEFSFAAAFADPLYAIATGGHLRRACTRRALSGPAAAIDAARLASVLQDHAGHHPADGWRMQMPCAHASWPPTRRGGQTTNSMIARAGDDPAAWFTGTSSPCVGVFKPVSLATDAPGPLAGPSARADRDSLWWRHERLHRTVLRDYEPRAAAFAPSRQRLQRRALQAVTVEAMRDVWREHHEMLPEWTARARDVGRSRRGAFAAFWRRQDRRDGLTG
jgi:dipeptidase